jgi:hypothetical protein
MRTTDGEQILSLKLHEVVASLQQYLKSRDIWISSAVPVSLHKDACIQQESKA